jgi:hypothetical protein
MKPTPVVHAADINPATDGSGRLVLALSLPRHVTKLFVDGLLPVAVKCSVYRLPVGFLVGFVVLQAQSHQARVVVPLWDEKSFLWLEQCRSAGSVSCVFISDDASDSRQFDFPVDFPALEPSVPHEMHQASGIAVEDVLLVIASSVPSMLQPRSVASLFPDFSVEEVSVCIVRDFFNTDACQLAAAELLGSKKMPPAASTPSDGLGISRSRLKFQ